MKPDGQTLCEIIADRKMREKLARIEAHVGSQPEWDLFTLERMKAKQQVSDAELERAQARWKREKEKRVARGARRSPSDLRRLP